MMPELKYEKGKISPNHFSELMRCILLNASGGIQRGEIIERFYGLDRRYLGYYVDNCLHGRQKINYERRYRRAQPAISKTLCRLEKRGLVLLIRHGSRNVKEIRLTENGKRMLTNMTEHQPSMVM